jgi:hypothetical protein
MVVMPELLLELADLRAHLDTDLGVEIGQRLVEEEDIGIEHEGPGEGHALLLTTRELPGIA